MTMNETRFDSFQALEDAARIGDEGAKATKRSFSLNDVWDQVQAKTRQGLGWRAPEDVCKSS